MPHLLATWRPLVGAEYRWLTITAGNYTLALPFRSVSNKTMGISWTVHAAAVERGLSVQLRDLRWLCGSGAAAPKPAAHPSCYSNKPVSA